MSLGDDRDVPVLAVLVIGAGVGFLAGLFGKGGSAIATPLLHLAGIPAIVAVAAPLPATIPSTAVAALPYWRSGLLDRRIVVRSLAIGVVATAVGAFATRWIAGDAIVRVTDVVLAGLGIRLLLRRHTAAVAAPDVSDVPDDGGDLAPLSLVPPTTTAAAAPAAAGTATAVLARPEAEAEVRPAAADDTTVTCFEPPSDLRIAVVAAIVGFTSGLLANSGGFLLAPLYLTVLKLPVKVAFACSLAVAAVIAIPGTIVHAALGHIDWSVVAVFGVASIPFSYVGARVALRTSGERLERWYGLLLVAAGVTFLVR
jgi:uncharacterized membrane protein YfcA